MPYHWVKIDAGTPPSLEPYKDDPCAFKREVHAIVTRNGGGLDELFWDVEANYAYALVHTLGQVDLAGIAGELEAHEILQLETAEERSSSGDGAEAA